MPVKSCSKLLLLLSAILVLYSVALKNVFALEPNNKFGIHIFDESDLPDASALVNSNGGEWGYVTMVIREDERDSARWQRIFDEMRRLKLIPIIRIASKMNTSYWEIPKEEEAVNWAGFFNSLSWPVKNRYIVLFNEPNHAKEWGGVLDPASYVKIAKTYHETFKKFSQDFYILPAALDLAASNTAETMDAESFFSKMHDADNYIFTTFDGINSHSYPNPGFKGSPKDTGKESIEGYKWELKFLENLGLNPETPVFITETGWALEDKEEVSENFKYAFDNVWNDDQVVAVTPFLLNYSQPPFSSFSWREPESKSFYSQYYAVQQIAKTKGEPEQEDSFEIEDMTIAESLVSDSDYSFSINIKNTGQAIWSSEYGYKILATSTMHKENIMLGPVPYTEPGQIAHIPIRLKTEEPRGIHSIRLVLTKGSVELGEIANAKFTLVSPPTVNVFARFWFGDNSNTASLGLYRDDELITKFENVVFVDGKAIIPAIKNVIPNKSYKFILSKPLYLPSVRNATLLIGSTEVNFGRLIPLDLNRDGNLSFRDILVYFQNPLVIMMNLAGI